MNLPAANPPTARPVAEALQLGVLPKSNFRCKRQRLQPVRMAAAAQNGAVLTGTDFIRPHLRDLAAYTPIGDLLIKLHERLFGYSFQVLGKHS